MVIETYGQLKQILEVKQYGINPLEGRVMMRGMMSYPQVTVGLFLLDTHGPLAMNNKFM